MEPEGSSTLPTASNAAFLSAASFGMRSTLGATARISPVSPLKFCMAVSALPRFSAVSAFENRFDCASPCTFAPWVFENSAPPSAQVVSKLLPRKVTLD